MKIGLISDIHADIESLKAALALLAGKGIRRILCMGDLVDKGPAGDAVVSLIRELDIPCVRGNHDEDAYGNQAWLRKHGVLSSPLVKDRLLMAETVDFVKNLPFSLRFEWGNEATGIYRILMVHGTPSSNNEYLLTTSRRERYEEIARSAAADVILFGHTHTAMSGRFEDVWFFNPGRVSSINPQADTGNNYDALNPSTCAILTLPDCEFQVYSIAIQEEIEVVHLK